MRTNTNNSFSCSYIRELNELEAEGYTQEEALAIMTFWGSSESEALIQEVEDISKRIENLKTQGMTQEQALEEVKPLLSKENV